MPAPFSETEYLIIINISGLFIKKPDCCLQSHYTALRRRIDRRISHLKTMLIHSSGKCPAYLYGPVDPRQIKISHGAYTLNIFFPGKLSEQRDQDLFILNIFRNPHTNKTQTQFHFFSEYHPRLFKSRLYLFNNSFGLFFSGLRQN